MSALLVHRKIRNTTKGFTLVELLVVITILAILSTIGLTVFGNVQKTARDAKRREDLQAIAKALEIYKAQNGNYPVTTDSYLSNNTTRDPWISGLTSSYMTSLPTDSSQTTSSVSPQAGGFTYMYYSSTYSNSIGGTYFELVARMESPSDNDKKTKCAFPGTSYSEGSANSGASATQVDTFYICSQQ